MNSQKMHAELLNENGNAAKLASSELPEPELTAQIYRLVYGREPTSEETELVVGLLTKEDADRRLVVEDVMWAMINSPEFVFQN